MIVKKPFCGTALVVLCCIAAAVSGAPDLSSTGSTGSNADTQGNQEKSWCMAEAADSVNRDSLEAVVRLLSMDPVTSDPTSRFTLRESEMSAFADSLAARLERYTGSAAERLKFQFTNDYYDPGETITTENIAAVLPGGGQGVVLVTAHYDATAINTVGWAENWETEPAPGADDNATGVAAVMEAARVLADYALPFDVVFVFFSAEELGKLGSEDFAERWSDLYGGEILAVLNIDMIGYTAGEPGASIISNRRSGWIANLLTGAAATIDPSLMIRTIIPGRESYDHGPFWDRGISAVSLSEPVEGMGLILHPRYHTTEDTIGWIDFGQVDRITGLVAGLAAGFSIPDPELALLASDILLLRTEGVSSRIFRVGDTVNVWIRMRNVGGSNPPPGCTARLEVALESRNGMRTLFSGDIQDLEDLGPLKSSDVWIPLPAEEGLSGESRIRASIAVSGFDDAASNNYAEATLLVEGGRELLLGHSFRPNPIRSSFSDAYFCLHLSEESDFAIDIFNVEGEWIASSFIGPRWGNELEAGLNCFGCRDLFPTVGGLSGGIYLYRLRSLEVGRGGTFTGKFAIER